MISYHRELLLDYLSVCLFAYVWETRNYLHSKTGKWYSRRQICAQLQKYGITRSVLMLKAKQQSEPLRKLYKGFIQLYSREQLVFLDETHCRPGELRRKYGYGIRGVGAYMPSSNIQHGAREASCAIACINVEGILSATDFQNETVNAQKLEANLVEEVLPKLEAYPTPNSVLVMDNAPTHNRAWVQEVCEQADVIAVFLFL
jgi:hypothetical protein